MTISPWTMPENTAAMTALAEWKTEKTARSKQRHTDGAVFQLHCQLLCALGQVSYLRSYAVAKVTVLTMNLVSPCLVSSANLVSATQLCQHLLGEDDRNLALVLSPAFSYKANGRMSEEQAVMKELAKIGANNDHTFSLIFANRCDACLIQVMPKNDDDSSEPYQQLRTCVMNVP